MDEGSSEGVNLEYELTSVFESRRKLRAIRSLYIKFEWIRKTFFVFFGQRPSEDNREKKTKKHRYGKVMSVRWLEIILVRCFWLVNFCG